jgi:DNA-binding transcriptional LysR family regulator
MKREDLGDLLNLLAIRDEGSFTKAATRLGISQPALSQAIRRLEERTGVRLLNRTTRGVSATHLGDELVEAIRPLFEEVSDHLQKLAKARQDVAGRISVVSPEGAARSIVWPAMAGLMQEHPALDFELVVSARTIDIVEHRFDAGIRLGEEIAKDMIAVRISPPMRMAAVAAPDYFTERALPRTPDDLKLHECIAYRRRELGDVYVWEFRNNGQLIKVRPSGRFTVSDRSLLMEAALAGFGIAFVPDMLIHQHLAEGSLIRVLEEWCEPFEGYHLYYPNRKHPLPGFSLLVEKLRFRG